MKMKYNWHCIPSTRTRRQVPVKHCATEILEIMAGDRTICMCDGIRVYEQPTKQTKLNFTVNVQRSDTTIKQLIQST